MLASGKIHPLLAFTWSGLCSDPEAAYSISREYEQQTIAEEEQRLKDTTVLNEQTGDVLGE